MKRLAKFFGFTRKRQGFTLVETLVAVLLIAIVVTSVFSLALSSKVASRKTGRRSEALYYTRVAMEKLKAYVTVQDPLANPSIATRGPNGGWSIPEDSCSGCGTAVGACWALQACQHDLTQLLPARLRNAPGDSPPGVTMTLRYTVTDDPCGGFTCKQVQFQVQWAETF